MMHHQHSDSVESYYANRCTFSTNWAFFLKLIWRDLKMTKIVIPGSYVWGSLSQNWQK